MQIDVEGISVAKYDPQQIANIFGFLHMVGKYCVTYDSDMEDTFFVHTDNKVIKFGYMPSKKYLQEVATAKGLSEDT